ncbi:MAG TPA: sigma-70 family RNA polymerase sigma factor [Elusimicrobiota bacterium]|jgi:RNA polymerase sigma-70 factor (ECF subfamily)|nr:sigma-70 family RNA polymerase sigma factor [Elusimicrobiota bacterium]
MPETPESDDLALVARARGGDADAFADLVRRHHARVHGMCASLVNNPADVEDAVQEVFLKVFRSLDRFQGEARFSTWLYRVVMNHCLDLRRRAAHRRAESLETLLEEGDEPLLRLLEAPESRRDAAEEAEEREVAAAMLAALPEEYREVLALRETQGLSYEDIAKTMECSVDSVKARLRRARAGLREKLRHFLKEGESK